MSRLGNITDYEKLVVEVWTNGAVAPDQSLLRASKLLRDHFDLFTPAGAEEEDEDTPAEPVAPGEAKASS
jgi:DNA-directed RNA polymerase subunit alpha